MYKILYGNEYSSKSETCIFQGKKKKLLLSALFSIILEYIGTILKNITIAFLQCQFTDSFSFTRAVFVTGC